MNSLKNLFTKKFHLLGWVCLHLLKLTSSTRSSRLDLITSVFKVIFKKQFFNSCFLEFIFLLIFFNSYYCAIFFSAKMMDDLQFLLGRIFYQSEGSKKKAEWKNSAETDRRREKYMPSARHGPRLAGSHKIRYDDDDNDVSTVGGGAEWWRAMDSERRDTNWWG